MYPIFGFIGVFLITTGVLFIGMISTLILGEETKSKPLDLITDRNKDLNLEGDFDSFEDSSQTKVL
jgi:putative MFS transporter